MTESIIPGCNYCCMYNLVLYFFLSQRYGTGLNEKLIQFAIDLMYNIYMSSSQFFLLSATTHTRTQISAICRFCDISCAQIILTKCPLCCHCGHQCAWTVLGQRRPRTKKSLAFLDGQRRPWTQRSLGRTQRSLDS